MRPADAYRSLGVARRTLSRSRFYIPLVLTLALFGLYWLLANDPTLIKDRDPRAIFLGKDLSYLLFGAYVALIFLTVRLLDAFVFDFIVSRRKNVVAPILLREIVSIILYLGLIAAVISSVFNKSVAGLLTTTTVLAAVIGLALQETLGNLFSGISLHMENTFGVGDVVQSGEFVGVVEVVNWRATRIRGFNDQIIVLPNSMMSRERIEVFPRNHLSARTVSVGADYRIPPMKTIAVIEQAVRNLRGVSKRVPAMVRINSFGDSSVVYEVKYWTDQYHLRDQIDAEIRKAIWYAFRRNAIPIPFPIRTLSRYSPLEESTTLSPSDLLERLQQVELLKPLSDEEHGVLAQMTRVHSYGSGETIIHFGEAGDSMFIVHHGSVAVRIPDGEHHFNEIANLGEGSVFGEMALLTGENRTADIVAQTDCLILEIDKQSLQPILTKNPTLADSLTATLVERRDLNAEMEYDDDQQVSMLGRIRSYFGI